MNQGKYEIFKVKWSILNWIDRYSKSDDCKKPSSGHKIIQKNCMAMIFKKNFTKYAPNYNWINDRIISLEWVDTKLDATTTYVTMEDTEFYDNNAVSYSINPRFLSQALNRSIRQKKILTELKQLLSSWDHDEFHHGLLRNDKHAFLKATYSISIARWFYKLPALCRIWRTNYSCKMFLLAFLCRCSAKSIIFWKEKL